MASIRKEILIDASPEDVWAAVRDWGALHERLVPGFVIDTRLDGEDRMVTFANGTVLRERLVDLDHETRRLVWSIVDGPYTHHNASAQVFARGRAWGQVRLDRRSLAERAGRSYRRGDGARDQCRQADTRGSNLNVAGSHSAGSTPAAISPTIGGK